MPHLLLQFDDTACVNATFDNADTSLDVVLGWNGKAIYEKDFSFSNFTKDCAKVRLMQLRIKRIDLSMQPKCLAAK